MTLQFNEGAYGQAFQWGQENNAPVDPSSFSQPLLQGLDSFIQSKERAQTREQQKKLYELQLDKAMREKKESDLENSTLGELLSGSKISSSVAPSSMLDKIQPPSGMGEGALPMSQQPGASMVEKFRSWQQGKLGLNRGDVNMSEPDINSQLASFGLPSEAASMTPSQIKTIGQAKKLFEEARGPNSVDAILAQKINSGQISLEDAIKMKQQSSGGSFMFGGMTENGQPVFYNTKDPSNVRTGQVPGGGILYPKTPPDAAMNASLFGKRAAESNQQLETLLSAGIDPTSYSTGLQAYLPNFLQSGGIQQVEQAKRNFINAVLRKESGATISNKEMDDANKQYFPQVGDSPEVLSQKSINRKTAIDGLNRMAGPLADKTRTNTNANPEQYLRSIGAKLTPANIQWAIQKMGGGM